MVHNDDQSKNGSNDLMGSIIENTHPPFTTIDQAQLYVQQAGQGADEDIDLFGVALALSFFDTPDADVQATWSDYNNILIDLRESYDALCARENGDTVAVQAMAIESVLTQAHGFIGDDVTYDDFRNINLFDVMERRMGMPISLSILAVSLCRSMGWQADGVNFPGHFLIRLKKDGDRLLVDPFQGFKVMEAKDLRKILKRVMGDDAELSANYYDPCLNRNTLLRHQNNLKFRLIDKENYEQALNIVLRMQIIAPQDHRLLLDKAVLYARLEQALAAIDAVKKYLEYVDDPYEKAEAEQFLYELQRQLN